MYQPTAYSLYSAFLSNSYLHSLLVVFADSMFLQLWPSIIWAILIGIASTFRCWKGALLTILLALLPIVAGYIYFGVSYSSDESFLVAGVIPYSDASMHFRQAAQMAVDGVTHTGMNGRFLYPAYFSSLLTITVLHLLGAQVLVGLLFAAALIVTLRVVARWIGAPGAIVVALTCWLFFRARCSGLVMTENLGITCGLLALTALLMATMRRSLLLLLLGIFILALGLCARPGALVVLPLMILFAGWEGWSRWGKREHECSASSSVKCVPMNHQDPSNSACCSRSPLPSSIFYLPSPAAAAASPTSLRPTGRRVASSLIAALLAVVMIMAAFSSNTLLSHTLYQGKVIENGNFAFTLYGMLTGGKWSDNLSWSHWNAPLVMKESLKLIQAKPQLLVFGAARAYKEAFSRRIFFMFNHESRLATLLLLLAAVGLVALWRMKPLRPHALWLTLMALGILLSLPFVPPWDAAERPFAVTVPFQALFAGIGLFALLRMATVHNLFSQLPSAIKGFVALVLERLVFYKIQESVTKEPREWFSLSFLWVLVVIVFSLSVPLPLLHKFVILYTQEESRRSSIELHPGSMTVLNAKNFTDFRRRLAPFLDHNPQEAVLFSLVTDQTVLGINWGSKNFDRCAVLNGVSEMVDFKGWRVDQRLCKRSDRPPLEEGPESNNPTAK